MHSLKQTLKTTILLLMTKIKAVKLLQTLRKTTKRRMTMMITLPKQDPKIEIVRNAQILILWIQWHQVITFIQVFIFVLEIDATIQAKICIAD